MNRQMRRAAAKNGRSDLVAAAGQLQRVLGQAETLQGLKEAPALLKEFQAMVESLTDDVRDIAAELHVRQQVLPRLLAELTGRSVGEVVGIEAALMAKARAESDL